MADLPDTVVVVIETPRGSLVKRGSGGAVDFVSPVPAPFNYGSVPDTAGPDGDPLDAVVLGPRLPRGDRAARAVLGVVRFVDRGVIDDKLVCGTAPPSRRERWALLAFFHAYAAVKRATGRGPSACLGLELR